MRKLLLLLAITPSFLFAQDNVIQEFGDGADDFSHYRWEIGINGGVNITSLEGLGADTMSLNSNIGRLYGITLTFHFNKYLALKTDFDMENKGWTINDVDVVTNPTTGATEQQDVIQNLNYFDIPAFLHVGFGNRMKFDFNFGPYFAFLLDDQAWYEGADGVEVPVTEGFSDFSETDFGLTYGAGIDFAVGDRLSLGFDFLIEKGLKEITSEGVKNQSIDFDFGINFLFGDKKKKKK